MFNQVLKDKFSLKFNPIIIRNESFVEFNFLFSILGEKKNFNPSTSSLTSIQLLYVSWQATETRKRKGYELPIIKINVDGLSKKGEKGSKGNIMRKREKKNEKERYFLKTSVYCLCIINHTGFTGQL